MLPSTKKALLVSVTVLLVGGIVTASAMPALASSQSSQADANNLQNVQEDAEISWNARLQSDETVWQNQRVYVNGAEVVNNASIQPVARASAQARTFEIRTVQNDSLGSRVGQFQVSPSGVAVIDMGSYEPGEYVISYEDMPVMIDDGDAEFTTDVAEASFGVATQTINASFDPDQADPDESTQLEVDSNRDSSYLISVTATGLHQAQVTRLFQEGEPFENSSVQSGTILRIDDDVEIQLFNAGIDPGTYEFQIDVLGASASDTTSLTVGEPQETGNETMGNETGGVGATPGNETGAENGTDDMFTDTPGNETDMPSDSDTPTESQPAGEESPTSTEPGDGSTETTTETGPGFGLLVAVVGLLGAALLARRRTD
ncbi:PGF-CTERM sorting domain-containing protein [Halorientalis brevis]|uniref:PGF-CTERM sorting domain-containing protein n=1 Tax=Halorientalis brevis TaxID=1126241 RepID=A0ABD6CDF7_9EURY|nr:PGF-CTERM sorting domain-containing protein [Halorientalis brevis]